jgi:multiple sugar transport system permease protein
MRADTKSVSVEGRRQRGRWDFLRRQREERLFFILALAPGLLLFVVLVGYALLNLALLSFQQVSTLNIRAGVFVGLATYQEVLGRPETWNAVRNSLVWIGGSVATITVLGVGVGVFLSRATVIARVTRAFMLVPWVLPGVVVAALWKWVYGSQTGILNSFLIQTDLLDRGFPWLGNLTTALFAVIVTMSWRLFPLFGLVVASAINTVDRQLYEAGRLDGASPWQSFWHITLPVIRPQTLTMILLSTIWVANNLVFIHVMTGGGPLRASEILPVYLYRLAFQNNALGESAVVSIINVLILLVIGFLYVRNLRRQDPVNFL